MNNENRLVPDFRPETVQTYTETYTPDGGTEQTAAYKIGTAYPIIDGILDKFSWIKTHVAAVWWSKMAGVTLKDKIDDMDGEIAQLNGKLQPYTNAPDGVTSFFNLPQGFYVLSSSITRNFTDSPTSNTGMCIVITTGGASRDERSVLLVPSTQATIYHGRAYGTTALTWDEK